MPLDRFRSLLDASLEAVITIDADGRVVDWNTRAEEIFGWTRAEVQGQPLALLVVPERDRAAFLAGMERYRKTGESTILNRRIERSALRKDGSEITVEMSTTVYRTDNQILFAAFLRDKSLQKRTERKLTRRTLEARLLHQSVALTAATESFEQTLRKCIDVLCEITGWPVGHVLLPDHADDVLVSTDIWHFDDPAAYEPLYEGNRARRFRPGEGFAGRIWQSGDLAWISDVRQEPWVDRDIKQAGVVGAFGFPVTTIDEDIVAVLEFFTAEEVAPDPQLVLVAGSIGNQLGRVLERKRWEAEQAGLAAIVDSSYDAIIGKSLDGRIVSWNLGAQKVYQFTAEEAVGQPNSIIFPEGQQEEEPEILDAIRTGKRLEQFETNRRRKDGRRVVVSMTVSPIKDAAGRIVGSSTIERDITKRIQREQELREAKDAAEVANRAKSQFLANVSHELRTPMNAIIGMVELALDDEVSPAVHDYLETARDSAHTLLYLLNDLLDFSRIEMGKFELDSEPFDLRRTLESAVKALSLRAHEKGLELICRIDGELPDRLLGDARRLRQVVTNLVGNAIKFTEQGEVVLTAGLQKREGDTAIVHCCVRDTGIGISAEHRKRIFAPFTQADASFSRKQTGTGLGLAICRELVAKMGGEIGLESEPGRGSMFSFTARFPVLVAAAGMPLAVPVEELKGMPVLVVDDNETNRTILSESLSNWKMRPSLTHDGRSALKEIKRAHDAGRRFPLIIVDALMPDMDGFTLIETLKALELMPDATVLMLSSADRGVFGNRLEELGIDVYLEKPVTQSGMLDAIMTALNGPQLEVRETRRLQATPRPLSVLVAEDTPANQKVVTAILQKRGHTVAIAHNGREAIEQHADGDFDVILMDIQMPTMDGLQATESIRDMEEPAKAATPIIAMTAHAMRRDRDRCLQAGMNAYLSKPIDAARLIELVESVAAETHRSSPARETSQAATSGPAPTASSAGRPLPTANVADHVFDRTAALTRLGGDEQLFRELVRFFAEDAPELLHGIEQGIQRGDTEQVANSAHSLRGLAATFDAVAVVQTAREIEQYGQQSRLEAAEEKLPELEKQVEKLTQVLTEVT